MPVDDVDTAVERAFAVDKVEDVYVGCGLRVADLGAGERGAAQHVVALPGFWLDLDVAGPAHADANLIPSVEDAANLIEAVGPAPTLIVDSGWGLHCWWLFRKPLFLTDDAMRLRVHVEHEAFQKRFQRGCKVDNTSDLARVLRIPGTRNHKVSSDVRDVVLLVDDGPRYDPSELVKRRVTSTPAGALPAVNSAELTERVVEKISKLKQPALIPVFDLVFNGQPFAKVGARDTTLQRLASTVAFVEPDATAEALAELFRPSIEAMAAEDGSSDNPSPTMADVVYKLERALEAKRALRTVEEKQLEALRRAARREKTVSPPLDAAGESPHADASGGGPYSSADVERFAKQQRCTVEEFTKRWIIQKGNAFYVYVDGAYQQPIVKDELANSLPRDFSLLPDFSWRRNDGKRKTLSEVLLDVTSVARGGVIADLAIPYSYYDPENQVYYERVCPVRSIRPFKDVQVNNWLVLLGGSDNEKLLDWLATATRLDRQSSALYLYGPKGTGKSMLAQGLARIWTNGAPTELGRVIGPEAFNADLTRCPLVWADERLPKAARENASTDLRALIGQQNRILSRKFLPNADLRGAVRVMITANNNRQLLDEDLTDDDFEAVAGRFLMIQTPTSAADYLDSIGGPEGTKSWVDGDRIAAHVLWLATHRVVLPGSRFLVHGNYTIARRQLAVQGRVAEQCLEWLCRHVTEPNNAVTQKGRIRVGGGKVLVNNLAIVDNWSVYVKQSKNPPTTTAVGRVLSRLSLGEERVGTYRFHSLVVKDLVDWSKTMQVGDPDVIEANAAKPVREPLTVVEGGKVKEKTE